MDNFALLVKTELLKQGLTQRYIAKQLKLSDAAISMYIEGKSKSERFNNWVENNLGICLKSHKGFTLMEMMISMVVISILMAASMPMISQFSTFKTGVDKNVMKCITASSSTGWYDTDGAGATALPTTEPCRAAVVDTQYNRGRALSTTEWYAKNGNSSQEGMAKKILRTACDQGGEKACDYFINRCRADGSGSAPYCDDTAGFLDVTYYLHQNKNTNTNNGATYIYNQLETLLPKMIPNFVNEVFYACTNTQTPNNNQNLGTNLACELAQPKVYIKACNNGNTAACTTAYNNNYNRSCKQIKTAWTNAPTGNYRLTYNSSGDYETVSCNMTSIASTTITGCNGATANLLGNAPNDDCTYAYSQGFNQTCPVIYANWSAAPTGTYNLTTNGAPPTALVSQACTYTPPNHAACMASGVKTVCDDGTVYAGDIAGRHIFTTLTAETGSFTWNSGTAQIIAGTTNTMNGQTNYSTLIGLNNSESPYAAARACKSLNDGPSNYGHTDWYLPAINELVFLCTNRVAVGNFPNVDYSGYWSSTEVDAARSSSLYSTTAASTYSMFKTNSTYVRCIRDEVAPDATCPTIGNTCADGTKYVGYFDSRYLFTTISNETGSYKWTNGFVPGAVVTGATDTTDGRINSNILIAASDSGAPYKAAQACMTLNANITRNKGYTDWYLPSLNEVNLLVGNSLQNQPGDQWSSTEKNINEAYSANYTYNTMLKYGSHPVRCIRSE